jgi:hypothetical protein
MGLVSMHRVRSYWEMTTRYSVIADKMSRNIFEKLASSLHVKKLSIGNRTGEKR